MAARPELTPRASKLSGRLCTSLHDERMFGQNVLCSCAPKKLPTVGMFGNFCLSPPRKQIFLSIIRAECNQMANVFGFPSPKAGQKVALSFGVLTLPASQTANH